VTTSKLIRALAGVVVLVILLITVNGWWTDYKKAAPKKSAAETTATPPTAEATAAPEPAQSVVILTDGLNFRVQPDATGKSIRGLKKGDRFVLVSKSGGWLELKDSGGQVGWVNNNPQYVRIEKK